MATYGLSTTRGEWPCLPVHGLVTSVDYTSSAVPDTKAYSDSEDYPEDYCNHEIIRNQAHPGLVQSLVHHRSLHMLHIVHELRVFYRRSLQSAAIPHPPARPLAAISAKLQSIRRYLFFRGRTHCFLFRLDSSSSRFSRAFSKASSLRFVLVVFSSSASRWNASVSGSCASLNMPSSSKLKAYCHQSSFNPKPPSSPRT